MSDHTHISWAEATWNPVTGCTRVSEGCDHCYIERTPPFRMQHRAFDKPGIGGTTGVKLHSDRLSIPLRWRKPRRVFVCSLADLFHDDVPDKFIAQVWRHMAYADQHVYQVLTKRPARMRALLSSPEFRDGILRAYPWPLPNVWLGTSVETQKWADIRIPILLDTPAAVRWISAEPLLEPLNLFDVPDGDCVQAGTGVIHTGHSYPTGYGTGIEYDCEHEPGLDWVVVGGESGPGARPMHPDWARSLRDQCQAAGVAYHFKQWGEWGPVDDSGPDGWRARRDTDSYLRGDGYRWPLSEPHGAEDGTEVLSRRVGKRRAGRLLDGRIWDEYPAVKT